jgi:hypothetical protein
MSSSTQSPFRFVAVASALVFATALLGGCAVVTVAGAAVGVAATGVGLVVDAGVGAVKLTGKAVGAAAGAVTGGSSD